MIPTGKCPKCEKVPMQVYIEHVEIKQKFNIGGTVWHGASYLCPHCNSILAVAIDPISLKADTVKEVCDALGVKPKKRV